MDSPAQPSVRTQDVVFIRRAGAFVGGLLVANSAPHPATAVTWHAHLTPFAGKDSSPAINLVWGLGNALGGLALTRTGGRRWDRSLIAFEVGSAAFALGWRHPGRCSA